MRGAVLSAYTPAFSAVGGRLYGPGHGRGDSGHPPGGIAAVESAGQDRKSGAALQLRTPSAAAAGNAAGSLRGQNIPAGAGLSAGGAGFVRRGDFPAYGLPGAVLGQDQPARDGAFRRSDFYDDPAVSLGLSSFIGSADSRGFAGGIRPDGHSAHGTRPAQCPADHSGHAGGSPSAGRTALWPGA